MFRLAYSMLSILILACNLIAAPSPMEPADRTLFVFVHGVNPKSANMTGDCAQPVDYSAGLVKGGAGRVFYRDDYWQSFKSEIFGSNGGNVAGNMYVRSLSNPASSPVYLARELGDRAYVATGCGGEKVSSLIVSAMEHYLETKWSEYCASGCDNMETVANPGTIREYFQGKTSMPALEDVMMSSPDLIPSRVVLIAHSMGGLTSREYLVSEYYQGDVDKLVTYDSPHKGSWAAYYNKKYSGEDGKRYLKVTAVEAAYELLTGVSILIVNGGHGTVQNLIGTSLVFDGFLGASKAAIYAGVLKGGGKYTAVDSANDYLTPGSDDLISLAPKKMAVNQNPLIVRTVGVDGAFSPDDPDKLLTTSLPLPFAPINLLGQFQSAIMSYGRDYSFDVGVSQRFLNALTSMQMAGIGVNFSQHGSIVVNTSSSLPDDVSLFQDVNTAYSSRIERFKGGAADAILGGTAEFGTFLALGTGLVSLHRTMDVLDVISDFLPVPQRMAIKMSKPVLATTVCAVGASTLAGTLNTLESQDTHDLVLKRGADAAEPRNGLTPTKIEDDFYEAPFAQVKTDVSVTGC